MQNRKIRVLHLLESGGMYGAENVVINLSREMLSSGLYEPIIGCITQYPEQKVELAEVAKRFGIESKKFVIKNITLPMGLIKFSKILKCLSIDLIHNHGYKASVFSYLCSPAIRVPLIATCHLWFEGSRRPIKMRVMVALEKFFYRNFATVVAVSEKIRETLISSGVPPKKVKVVRNGIVLSDYKNISTEQKVKIRKELRLGKCEYAVFNVGRLTEQKAQSVLIDAAELVRKHNNDIKFFIVGEGELERVLERKIVSQGLRDCVKLLGFRDDVSKLLHVADIFALPSLDEGMPIALLEAVACKVPVIATAVGDVPKIIEHKESGIIVQKNNPEELCEAIWELIDDPKQRSRFAKKALSRVAQAYSSESMFKQYDEIYRSIIC